MAGVGRPDCGLRALAGPRPVLRPKEVVLWVDILTCGHGKGRDIANGVLDSLVVPVALEGEQGPTGLD